jgi:hypothetical protein
VCFEDWERQCSIYEDGAENLPEKVEGKMGGMVYEGAYDDSTWSNRRTIHHAVGLIPTST